MAIWGSLNTSAIAMNAHSHVLGQISTNIANMNTVSYKEVDSQYQTLMSGGKAGIDYWTATPVDHRQVSGQGSVLSTGWHNDLAINGQGFFLVNTEPDGSGSSYYTRDGGFMNEAYTMATDTDGNGVNDQGSYLITRSGQYVMGYPALDGGGFGATPEAVRFNFDSISPGVATQNIAVKGNVTASEGRAAVYNTSFYAITTGTDASGAQTATGHNLPFNWAHDPASPNGWTVTVPTSTDVASATVTPANVLFKGDGTLDTVNGPSQLTVNVTWNDGSDPSTIVVDITNLTQFASGGGTVVNASATDFYIGSLVQDGQLSGSLTGTFFDSQGTMYGNFNNGVTKPIYRLPIALFAAPDQLEAFNGNLYRPTELSGDASLVTLTDSNSVASVTAGALEQSNVDLEDQFSRMIVTQKAYSMSATALRTADEMIQEATSIKR